VSAGEDESTVPNDLPKDKGLGTGEGQNPPTTWCPRVTKPRTRVRKKIKSGGGLIRKRPLLGPGDRTIMKSRSKVQKMIDLHRKVEFT